MEFFRKYKIHIIVFVVIAIVATGLGVGLTLGLKKQETKLEEIQEEIPEIYWDDNNFEILPACTPEDPDCTLNPEDRSLAYYRAKSGAIAGTYIQTDKNYPIWINSKVLEGGGYRYGSLIGGEEAWDPWFENVGDMRPPFLFRNKAGTALTYFDNNPSFYFGTPNHIKSGDLLGIEAIKQIMDQTPDGTPGTWVQPSSVTSMFDESVRPLPDPNKFENF